jgi:DNA polymerase-3 subunit epsilon
MTGSDTPVRGAVWAALDFESTGVVPGAGDEPVQVGMAVWRGGEEPPGDFFRSYIRPAVPVTGAARAVHGIGAGELAGAPPMAALWPEFRARLGGAAVVAHGAGTERRFLRAFPLHGFGPWVDTLALGRAALPGLPEHSLAAVCGAFGLEAEIARHCPGLGWHDALFDAVACLVFLRRVVEEFGLDSARIGQLQRPDTGLYHRHRAMRRTARICDLPPDCGTS